MNLAFKTVVVATDFSASADLALEYARAIATRFQATLHLVHVVQEPYPIGVEGDVPDVSAFRESLLQAAHDRMTSLLATTHGATGEVLVGPPAARIVEAASSARPRVRCSQSAIASAASPARAEARKPSLRIRRIRSTSLER